MQYSTFAIGLCVIVSLPVRSAELSSVDAVHGTALPTPGADALGCMTAAIYHEAAQEPLDGQRAIARVVLNRLLSPSFPKSVCGVVYQGSTRTTGCQFSFTCDGALHRRIDVFLWQQANDVAVQALAHPEALPALSALHYHATYVRPSWAGSMREETRIGRHVFYASHHMASALTVGKQSTQAATFSAWGLPIARVTPTASGVTVGEIVDGPG